MLEVSEALLILRIRWKRVWDGPAGPSHNCSELLAGYLRPLVRDHPRRLRMRVLLLHRVNDRLLGRLQRRHLHGSAVSRRDGGRARVALGYGDVVEARLDVLQRAGERDGRAAGERPDRAVARRRERVTHGD